MVLVHGIAEHSGRYDHVGRFFAERGIDVLGYDQRGHGETHGTRGYVGSFSQLLDDVEDLIAERRSLGVPVVLMGHSLGGLVAASYAVSSRPQPDLLVLSAPALSAEVPGWQRVVAPILSKVAPKLALPSDFDGGLLSRDPEVGEAYRTDPLRVRKISARLGAEIFTRMDRTTSRLDRISIPTYVLHGADDALVPEAASRPLADVPGVIRVVHDGLRHECLNEPEQDAVLEQIMGWLDDRLVESAP